VRITWTQAGSIVAHAATFGGLSESRNSANTTSGMTMLPHNRAGKSISPIGTS
jgi:hypothetical protein